MIHTFKCIDAHTCGNPVRVVAEGGPELIGKNMSEKRQHFLREKRQHFLREYDWIRKGLMFEPRGHDMMSGSILYPPSDPANDVGVLFIETSGCLPMCGHGTIGTVTIAIEEGLVKPKTPGVLNLEVPAGLVRIEYKQEGKKVKSVKIRNVKAYLAAENITAECPDLGELTLDVSYGGNFYAIVDVQKNFPGLEHYTADQLISWSRALRKNINGVVPYERTSTPNTLLFIPIIRPLMGAVIFYGRVKYLTQLPQHAMRCFMEIRQLIVRHVAQEPRHDWRNGLRKVN